MMGPMRYGMQIRVLCGLLCAACATNPQATSKDPITESDTRDTGTPISKNLSAAPSQRPGADLVFEGKLIELKPTLNPGSRIRWIVKMRVDRVVSGRFSGDTFSFGVHSPAKSNLVLGGTYEVRATAVPGGYEVDELQWGARSAPPSSP